jgi:glycine/D-amino acid oxidase-like deaminating enzyme
MTRTKYGVSPWIEQVPRKRRPDFPRFRGNSSYPAVIVGGGLAGAMTAYAFAAAGVKVALLEADRVGLLGGGRGPGVLQSEAAASYRDLETRHGRKVARALFEGSRRAVLDLATTARRLGVKNGVDVQSALRVLASYTEEEKPFAKEVALRRDAGLDAVWLKAAAAARESGIDAARAAVRLRDWGRSDPYRLVTAFCSAAAKRGAEIFEQSPVRRIRVRRKDVEIQADGGVLTANTVMVCTGEPTDLFRSLKRHVRFDERYIVLTDRLPAPLRRRLAPLVRLLTDTDSPPHIVCWTDEGQIVVGGADQPRSAPRTKEKLLVQRTGQLMYELSRMYPDVSGVMPTHGWDLPVATTADGVMYAGPHRNYPHHLFAWATRHDPAQAFLASRILLRRYLDAPDRDDAYFAFTRG